MEIPGSVDVGQKGGAEEGGKRENETNRSFVASWIIQQPEQQNKTTTNKYISQE